MIRYKKIYIPLRTRKISVLNCSIIPSILKQFDRSWINSNTISIWLQFHNLILLPFSYTSSNSSCIIDTQVNNLLVAKKNITPTDSNSQLVLIKLLYTCEVLLSEATFPKDWFDLLILRDSVVLSALFHVSARLNSYHIAGESCFSGLDKQIWRDYFQCMVVLAVDGCLQLEGFNENKRRIVMDRWGLCILNN